jgi:hypothetical protein
LDEEDRPGQDETTLRPSSETSIVDPSAVFTAGEAIQANGTTLPALIEVDAGRATGVSVFLAADTAWSVRELGRPPRWTAIVEDWLEPEEREPSVALTDTKVFPLEVRFRLPHAKGQLPLSFRIMPDGTSRAAG